MRKEFIIPTKILRKGVKLPTYAHEGDSGMDVRAYGYSYTNSPAITHELLEDVPFILESNERILIKTGIAMSIPNGYEIQVRDRSGCALKSGIMLVNSIGTIDSIYRGEIGVILYNSDSNKPFIINKEDRIAQLVLIEVPKAILTIVDDLDKTDREDGGYGSTNKME